jgi:hypothetical protein
MKFINNFLSVCWNQFLLLESLIHRTAKAVGRKSRSLEKGNRWIRPHEFKNYVKITAWITSTSHMRANYNILIERITKLINASGFTWTFAYLKEVSRLTTRALAGTPDFSSSFVGRDKYGLPTVIPGYIREVLRSFIDKTMTSQVGRRIVIATLSILSIYRTFPTTVLPSLVTVMEPFSGITKLLPKEEMKAALISMGHNGKYPRLCLGNFKPLLSQKAGPNGTFATWSAGIDAIAFISTKQNRAKILPLVQWMLIQRAYGWAAYFIFLILAFGWILLILQHSRICRHLVLGKLGVVYNQAGKARVVAATNWWYQSAFAGLHESIFQLLKGISQDGTHDQETCFNKFLTRSDFRENLTGFDLSAATDRLPIDLQIQILNELGLPGDLWRELLDISWLYIANEDTTIVNPDADTEDPEGLLQSKLHTRPDGTFFQTHISPKGTRLAIRYEVGQPMGALSSWAMLALSHHVIARIAFIKVQQRPSLGNYCILGDDIVINHDRAAGEYLKIMADLGLKISLGKSIVSKRFTEFAKKLKGFGLDITPLGAGIILSASRSAYYLPALVLKAIDVFCLSPERVLELIRNLPGGLFNKRTAQETCRTTLLMTFANNTWYREISLINVRTLKRYTDFFSADIALFPDALWVSLRNLANREFERQKDAAHMVLANFISEALTLFATRGLAMRLLELLMKPFNPGFWIYLLDAFRLPHKIDQLEQELTDGLKAIPIENGWDRAKFLFSKETRASVVDIANLKDEKAKLVSKFYLKLYKSISYKIYL